MKTADILFTIHFSNKILSKVTRYKKFYTKSRFDRACLNSYIIESIRKISADDICCKNCVECDYRNKERTNYFTCYMLIYANKLLLAS